MSYPLSFFTSSLRAEVEDLERVIKSRSRRPSGVHVLDQFSTHERIERIRRLIDSIESEHCSREEFACRQ